MAVIRPIEARNGLDTGGMPSVRIDNGIAEGLASVGDALSRAGAVQNEIALRRERMNQENAEFGAEQSFLQFKQNVALKQSELETGIDPSGAGYSEKVSQEYEQQASAWLNTVPENIRPRMSELLVTHRNGVLTGAAAKEADQRRTWFRTAIDGRANELASQVVQSPDQFDAAVSEGMRLIDASGLPPVEKEAMKKGMRKTLLLSKAENYKRTDPSKIVGPRVGNVSNKGNFVRDALVRDLGISRVAAAAFAGNLHIETGGFNHMQELAPVVPGSRGGYGWSQWTGPRRRQFEAWVAERGLDINSDEANYGFLVHELTKTGEGKVLKQLQNVTDPKEAALIVSRVFLRPGIPHESKRVAATMRYYNGTGGEGEIELSPEFAELEASDRLKLFDEANAAYGEIETQQAALAKAEYASMKDSLELGIATGQVKSQQDILNTSLSDGDKATLIRSLGQASQSEAAAQEFVRAAVAGEDVAVNPYDTDQRSTADKAFETMVKVTPPEGLPSVERAFVEATGYVPKPVVADLRMGAASTDPANFAETMARADILERNAPLAFGAIDGVSEVRTALEQYRSRINNMGMDAEQAARDVLKARSPERVMSREALKPELDKFLKTIKPGEIANAFDNWLPFNQPDLPLLPAQQNELVGEYRELAEQAFLDTGGDADAAKAIAQSNIKRMWGLTTVSGGKTLMRLPPENFYPKVAGSHEYLRTDAMQSAVDWAKETFPERNVKNVALVPVQQTRADIEAGVPPRYEIGYQYETPEGLILFDKVPSLLWSIDGKAKAKEAFDVERMAVETASPAAAEQRMQEQIQSAPVVPMMEAQPAPADNAFTGPSTPGGRIADTLPGIDPALKEMLTMPGTR